jgi:hypothetical protein
LCLLDFQQLAFFDQTSVVRVLLCVIIQIDRLTRNKDPTISKHTLALINWRNELC